MSGKPLVFIDWPDQCPLRPEVRAAFEEGLFLFDGGSSSLHEDLRVFLSQPLTEIERLWAARAGERETLLQRFFTSGLSGGGRRAAAAIEREIAMRGG